MVSSSVSKDFILSSKKAETPRCIEARLVYRDGVDEFLSRCIQMISHHKDPDSLGAGNSRLMRIAERPAVAGAE